eukprot:Skav216965  [mRNA]  locus=scaffold2531:164041:165065:+ [translate_table: standard]
MRGLVLREEGNKKLAENITLTEIAQRTAGFSGADLENLMNESAILAARRNKKAITMDEINDATDRVIAGHGCGFLRFLPGGLGKDVAVDVAPVGGTGNIDQIDLRRISANISGNSK